MYYIHKITGPVDYRHGFVLIMLESKENFPIVPLNRLREF